MKKKHFQDIGIVEYVLFSISFLLLLLLAFILTDVLASKPEAFAGTVIDKQYKPEQISTGTGTTVTPNGSVGIVTTTQIDSEDFLIMVKTNSGGIATVKCSHELYYSKQIGQSIICERYTGLFTGATLSIRGVK